ncbi:MAG: LysR family transcriptional regulator [Eubacteriales bacterium]|nr:LysR family transcriptional regulator [Eubacteriales bacterium]
MLRASLGREQSFWGPGITSLLHQIDACHSLRAAAKGMGISYSKAWKIVHHAEQELGFALVQCAQGGSRGGGSRLTEQALALLRAYDAMQDELKDLQKSLYDKYFSQILKGG